jgi:photosystem II stability/assembly factor-like uncharacterized protein
MNLKTLIIVAVLVQSLSGQWLERKNGLPESFRVTSGSVIEPIDSLTAYVTIRDDKFYKTTDAGLSWQAIHSESYPDHIRIQDMSAINEDNIWVCGDSGGTTYIYASADGGISWEQEYLKSDGAYLYFIEMFSSDQGMAIGCSYSDAPLPVVQKTEAGNQWFEKNQDFLRNDYGESTCISIVNMDVAYFQKKWDTLYKTSDGGETWDSIYTPPSGQTVKFYDDRFGLLATVFGRILKSVDGGISWEEISNLAISGPRCLEFLPTDPGKIWLSISENLFFSEDSGKNWTEYTIGEGFKSYDIDFVDALHGWIMAEDMVYYTKTGNRIVTDIRDKPYKPVSYTLEQNYPNPFNPSTTIEFSLPKSDKVNISVYNLLGQSVKTLKNEVMPAGKHKVIFYAEHFSSGIYYYRIESSNYKDMKKMIILK